MGFTLQRSTEADLKTKYFFFLPVAAFIWCLTTPHAKTYITSDFTAIQSKICGFFSSSLFPPLTVVWILLMQIKTEKLNLNFGQTQIPIHPPACKQDLLYLCNTVHQVRNRSLWTNRCWWSELSFPVIPLMSLWMSSMFFKSREDKGARANF